MRKAFTTGVMLLILSTGVFAQDAGNTSLQGREIIGRQLEELEELAENGSNISELTAGLEYRLEHPLNLNEAGREELAGLLFLNDIQIKNILDYRKKYGYFLSVYELKAIDGLGRPTLEKIAPFVMVAPPKTATFRKKSLFRGKHGLFLRYQRQLVARAGYSIPEDSLQEGRPGSFYLGNPDRYYLRYRYRVPGCLSIGITAEKDPGEMFTRLPDDLSGKLRREAGRPPVFDFFSFHAYYEGNGLLRKAIAGDYHARFGQGLVVWSGLSFARSSDPASVQRYATGFRPYTSSGENAFFRGGAITLAWKKLQLSMLYSRRGLDANIEFSDSTDTEGHATSLPQSGYHRSLAELQDRKAISRQDIGGSISLSGKSFRAGISIIHSKYSKPVLPDNSPANIYRFRGRENTVGGMHAKWLLRRTILFGELAGSRNGGWALLAGLSHTSANGSIFSLLFREYKAGFQNPLAQASGRREHNANERGGKLMMELPVSRELSMQASAEHYSYPWITGSSINRSRGQEYRMRLQYDAREGHTHSFRYRYRAAGTSHKNEQGWFDHAGREQKHDLQLVSRNSINTSFSIKIQAAYLILMHPFADEPEHGSLLLFKLYFVPEASPFRLIFSYALFHTDSYAARMYAYEHDVLYASSMPAYYGRGTRFYVLGKYSPARWLDAWARFSISTYADRDVISGGADEIAGNILPEIKVQLRFKL